MATMAKRERPVIHKIISYLDQVKFQYPDNPDVRDHCLKIIADFNKGAIDTLGAIRQISTLFAGNPDLVYDFNIFLPPGYKIEYGTNEDPNAIRVTAPRVITISSMPNAVPGPKNVANAPGGGIHNGLAQQGETSRLPDLVLDSKLRTQFLDSTIVHTYLEIDNTGERFSREERWKAERYLGRGGFGQVRLEKCITNATNQNSLRAVKVINKPLNQSKSLDFNRELDAISKFSHDRYKRWFVKSFGWFENLDSIFITMEYCRYGDLHHYLISQHIIAAEEVQELTYQMLEALDQMHQNDFAHRDLKPANILIKSMPPDEKWWIVLADFGISKRADGSNGPMSTVKGTPTFMAPELLGLQKQFKPRTIVDFKAADMWALGEIVVLMLTGKATFQDLEELMEYCKRERSFRIHISVRADCHELVAGIMAAIPSDRMTTTQSLQHSWIQPLRIEKELGMLDLQHTGPLPPDDTHDEGLASARWSDLSNPEYTAAQTTARQIPARLPSLDFTGISIPGDKLTSGSAPTERHQNSDDESLVFLEEPIQTFEGHELGVNSVAFSHDSTRLASGGKDGAIWIWNASSGKCVRKLVASGILGWRMSFSTVRSVAFSHDSTRLVSLHANAIRIWDTSSDKCLQTPKSHGSYVISVAFSHNSTWLASGSWNATIKIWDLSGDKCLQTLKGHKSHIRSVAFSHDSTWLASGSYDKTIKIWDPSNGKCLRTLKHHGGPVWSIAFSHNSTWLASGATNGTAFIWDASNGKCLQALKGHKGYVTSVAFSHDSARLVSGSQVGTIKIWKVLQQVQSRGRHSHAQIHPASAKVSL